MIRTRCAIYTRKSSEEGLEQEFNSLDAQREACAAYVASQKAEGWVPLPETYDDGGLSGGTLDRPALTRLLRSVDAGLVDRIIVYKIDRLTRSLADFAKIVERLDAAGASFVSVTQSFNTATSMGRLTLNMLLSFAQFEREVTAERIRDKIAASKRKGLWMGGQVPLGYAPDSRTLKIREDEAETVRTLYRLYLERGSIVATRDAADELGLRSRRRIQADGSVRGGIPMDSGHIHHILTNPIYVGRIRHKDEVYAGQHPAIIDPATWNRVQAQLMDGAATTRGRKKGRAPSPLVGKLYDETGDRLTPSHTKMRSGKRLRYYVSRRLIRKAAGDPAGGWRLPAPELEQAIAGLVQDKITGAGFITELLLDATADEIVALRDSFETSEDKTVEMYLSLIDRVDIAPGEMRLRLSVSAIAIPPQISIDRLNRDALTSTAPFTTRKRGVETRLVINNAPAPRDTTLIRNIAQAQDWMAAVKSGKDTGQIAARHGTSKRRVQQLLELAFLAPDIVKLILEGRQPVTLTSELLLRDGIPSDWAEQRRRLLADS